MASLIIIEPGAYGHAGLSLHNASIVSGTTYGRFLYSSRSEWKPGNSSADICNTCPSRPPEPSWRLHCACSKSREAKRHFGSLAVQRRLSRTTNTRPNSRVLISPTVRASMPHNPNMVGTWERFFRCWVDIVFASLYLSGSSER
jgi:hypothetical protein